MIYMPWFAAFESEHSERGGGDAGGFPSALLLSSSSVLAPLLRSSRAPFAPAPAPAPVPAPAAAPAAAALPDAALLPVHPVLPLQRPQLLLLRLERRPPGVLDGLK